MDSSTLLETDRWTDSAFQNLRSLAVCDTYIALGYTSGGGEVKLLDFNLTELTSITGQTDLEGMAFRKDGSNYELFISRNNEFHSGVTNGERVWKYEIG